MADDAKPARPSRVTVPEHCHPLAKIVFDQMHKQRVTYQEMEFRSGVLFSTMKAWRRYNTPGLETVAACLGALDWDLVAVPRSKLLPPDLVAELDALAEKWGEQLAPLRPMFIAAAARAYETLPLTRAGSSRLPEHQPALAA